MYARHYGLRQEPFSIAPDPRYLFMSERHREALAHLLYGLQSGGGFVLLTGEIGAGKTTVCRAFLEQVPAHCHVACIFNPHLTVEELLQTVCEEFGVETTQPGLKARVDALNAHLLRVHAAGENSVLVIDEAQGLAPAVLEQLRLLTNLETHERKLLQIILIGQPELRSLLARPELEQLAQRIIARFHLGPLSPADAEHYIHHRLAVAGLQGALPFDRVARKRIHALTGGVPRRINLLCDRALLGGYARGLRRIGPALVDQAAREVFGHPASPTSAQWQRMLALAALGAASLLAVWALWTASQRQSARGTPASASASAPASSAPRTAAAVPALPPSAALPSALLDGQAAPWRWPVSALAEAPQLRALAALWGATLAEGDPCEAARLQQLQCFRRNAFTLAEMRQLGRPGIVTLQDPAGTLHAARVAALGEDRITLQLEGQAQTLPLAAFATAWRGDFATFWRTTGAESPPTPAWLGQQLDRLPGSAAAASAPLASRIQVFQRTHGLEADGVAGSMTLMQLNRALGVDEPRLPGVPRTSAP